MEKIEKKQTSSLIVLLGLVNMVIKFCLNACRFFFCVVLFISLLLHFLNIGAGDLNCWGWIWCVLLFLLCFWSIYKLSSDVKVIFFIFTISSVLVGWILGATDSLWCFFIYPIALVLWYVFEKRKAKNGGGD